VAAQGVGTIPANVKLVVVDFDRGDLGSIPAAQGYSTSKYTFFVWEPVTQYVTEQGVSRHPRRVERATSGPGISRKPGSSGTKSG
jgi:O-methyltransferase involved in polyketide biosynthesis